MESERTIDSHLTHATLAWHTRLNEAARIEHVVGVVRDYLAQWSPVDLARLPGPCRPGRIVDADDITLYALILVKEEFNRDPKGDAALTLMACFFAAASRRVSQILAHTAELPRASSAEAA